MNVESDAAPIGAALDRLPDPKPGTVVVCTLGGVADIGMNLTLYGAQGGWVLVDAGTTFAPRETVGVEAVMPDPHFLAALGGTLKGLVVSHYHEDHVGAITRYWPKYTQCPIYAPPFAARMLTGKFQDRGLRGTVKIKTFEPGSTLNVGPFRIRTIRVAHSTPDCVAFGFEAQGRRILQTNDWKIDENPGIGSRTDIGALKGFGRQGVELMLCDSTNADREAPQTSEASVRRSLEAVMRQTRGMVFVCSFGSNVARMASVAQAAKAARRKVALAGRALRDAAEAAEALGLMKGVPPFLDEASKFKGTQRNGCVLMCTGTQGEENASLAKLANGRDARLPKVQNGDTVVMSARAIPGNEDYISAVTDKLRALGARIVTSEDRFEGDTVHVTGHPVRADLRIMYDAVAPRFALPVHGSPAHLAAHASLALELGVEAAITPVNGGVYELSERGFACLGGISSRLVAVMGDGAGTMVPWDDGAKAAVLTMEDRERLDDYIERERARGDRLNRRRANDTSHGGDKSRGKQTGRSANTRDATPVRGAQKRPFKTVIARPAHAPQSAAPATTGGTPMAPFDTGRPRQDGRRPTVSRRTVVKASAELAEAQPKPPKRKAAAKPAGLDRNFIEMMSKAALTKRRD